MTNIVVHEESEADKSYRIHYSTLSQVDHDWYVAQTQFAIECLRKRVAELGGNGNDYEPDKPDDWSIKFDAAAPYLSYLCSITRMICKVSFDKLGEPSYMTPVFEKYPPSMRPERKNPRLAFDNQPQTPLPLANKEEK